MKNKGIVKFIEVNLHQKNLELIFKFLYKFQIEICVINEVLNSTSKLSSCHILYIYFNVQAAEKL